MADLSRAGRLADGAVSAVGRTSRSHSPPAGRVLSRPPEAVAAFLVAAASVVWLGFDQGGYFPVSWSLPTLALFWVAMLVLVFGRPGVPAPGSATMFVAAIGLTAWTGLSVFWSAVPAQSVLELERALLYVAALSTALLLGRNRLRFLVQGVTAGVTVVCLYALAVRLLPNVFGVVEPSRHQAALNEPVGYSNALGLLAALGVILALGLVPEDGPRLPRALAGAAVVPLTATIYFTFSRGAWLALVVGIGVVVVSARSRMRVLATWLEGPLPLAVLAVLLASRADALTRVNPPLDEAAREGALLLVALLAAAVAAGASTLTRARIQRRATGRGGRIVVALALSALVPVTLLAGGHLHTVGREAATLRNEHGVSVVLSHRDAQWQAAWNAFGEQPLIGRGAGTFGQYWLEHRTAQFWVRDAHNLYLEVLAELGIVGLALIVVLFGVPLVVGARRRSEALVPASLGALSAFLVHASIDWDWEMPALTVAAIFLGAGLVTTHDGPSGGRALSPAFRVAAIGAALAASAFAAAHLVDNRSTAEPERALAAGRFERAHASARRAPQWASWSDRRRLDPRGAFNDPIP